MPLLLLVRPPGDKVTPGESHRVEDESMGSFHVYCFEGAEWRLQPREVLPGIVDMNVSKICKCIEPVESLDPVDGSFTIPSPPGARHIPHSYFTSLQMKELQISVELSEIAYSNPKDLMNDPTGSRLIRLVEPGFPVFFHNVISIQDSCQCFMWKFEDDRCLYIAFRGSSCLSDSIADLVEVRIGSKPRGLVNKSLLEQFKLIEPFLRDRIERISSEVDSIVCTGHSIGGACATIAAPVFAYRFATKLITCISYGAPRVCDREFGQWFRESVHRSLRFVNEGDPISTVPRSNTILHVTDAISIRADGVASIWPETDDSDNWNLTWQETLFHLRASRIHSTVEYRERISRLLNSVHKSQRLVGI